MIRALLTFALIFCGFAANAQSEANETTRKNLQNKYLGFLIREGYGPEIDDDGDVQFNYNGDTYYITIHPEDESFFRIARLTSLELTSTEDINRAIKICHDITMEAKVAKMYWRNDVIWTSTELIFSGDDDFEGIFEKAMELTEEAYNSFVSVWTDEE